MTASARSAITLDAFDGRGLEMFQAIIDHFIPSAAVNIPTIYREYAELHQAKDELVVAYINRVTKLANRSKQGSFEYTEVTQILTFVNGLHGGFHDFTKDFFSGRISLTATSLQDTTVRARTLEQRTFDKKVLLPRSRGDLRPRAHRAGRLTPDNNLVDITSGPLSCAQVDALFDNFKCPLCPIRQLQVPSPPSEQPHMCRMLCLQQSRLLHHQASRRVTSSDTASIDEPPAPPPESPAPSPADDPAPTPDDTPLLPLRPSLAPAIASPPCPTP